MNNEAHNRLTFLYEVTYGHIDSHQWFVCDEDKLFLYDQHEGCIDEITYTELIIDYLYLKEMDNEQ